MRQMIACAARWRNALQINGRPAATGARPLAKAVTQFAN
jgi:hypothetical protein